MRRTLLLALLLALSVPATALAAPINAVAGDLSWRERFGRAPTAEDDARETERIQTHLAWVERELRARPVSHLSGPQRARRKHLLDALAVYREAAAFPRNTDHPGRRPRFVDPEGRTCAVGHLIDVTGQRALTESIAARFEYAYLADIRDPRLAAWIAESGFTARELAMIQPSYHFLEPEPPPRPVEPPAPPPMEAHVLVSVIQAARASAQACMELTGVHVADLVIVDHPRGRRTVQARTRPRRRDAESCVRAAVTDALLRANRAPPARPLRLRTTYYASPPTPRLQTLAAAREAIDARHAELAACMPRYVARNPGALTVRVRVGEDGRLEARSVRFPRFHGTPIGAPTDAQVEQCVTDLVGSIELPNATRVDFTYQVPFGGTHDPLAAGQLGVGRGVGGWHD